MTEWLVQLAAESGARADLLTAEIPFEEILTRVRGRSNSPKPRRKFGKVGGPFEGSYRAVWTITPRDQKAVDLFFNGRRGYRAAYRISVQSGKDANDEAVQFLASWLRDFSGASVAESAMPLLGVGAKLWIPEDERTNRALITGQVLAREILVPAWLEAAEMGKSVSTSKGERFKAAAGVLSPLPTRLNVFGAWIRGTRTVDARVKDRDYEIHSYGYT